MELTSSLEAKFGARSGQVHKIGGKIWEVLSPKGAKVGTVPILGSYLKFRGQNLGYLSFLFLEAKFGAKPPTSYYESTPLGHFQAIPCVIEKFQLIIFALYIKE